MPIPDKIANMQIDFGSSSSDFTANTSWRSDYSKSYYFLKGYATAKRYYNMQKSLVLAQQFHDGQKRKGGADYLVHPLRVCTYLVSLNFDDDVLLSAALLHDVIEDNDLLKDNPNILVDVYKIDEEVLRVVQTVTKQKGLDEERTIRYFDGIKRNWRALLVKISDRVNNVSTMAVFTPEKRQEYIDETRRFVIPLCSYGKLYYPELSNALTAMKYHITSICDSIEYMNK